MAACTWPSNSNLSQTLKKAKNLKLRQLLSRWSVPTTFHGGIVSKLPTQTWNIAKISPHIPLKTTLFKRENHSANDAFWLVESVDTHRLEKRENDRRTGFWVRLHPTLFFLRWHSRLTEIWHFSRETSCSIYKSTRERVDSRNKWRWRLHLMGSWWLPWSHRFEQRK